MTIDEILDSIAGGQVDEYLPAITKAVRSREQAKAERTLFTIRPGSKVRFNHTIRPAYLRGKEAVVVKVNDKSVVVKFDRDPMYGRFSGHQNVRVPATLIEGFVIEGTVAL